MLSLHALHAGALHRNASLKLPDDHAAGLSHSDVSSLVFAAAHSQCFTDSFCAGTHAQLACLPHAFLPFLLCD